MTFRMEKLTLKAQEAVVRAQSLASEKGHPEIDSLHLLAALLGETEGIVKPLLERSASSWGNSAGWSTRN